MVIEGPSWLPSTKMQCTRHSAKITLRAAGEYEPNCLLAFGLVFKYFPAYEIGLHEDSVCANSWLLISTLKG
jgi:hypothetical protein